MAGLAAQKTVDRVQSLGLCLLLSVNGVQAPQADPVTRIYQALTASLTLTLVLSGCTDRNAPSTAITPGNSSDTNAGHAADQWLGQWTGPEGTFLRLEGGEGSYTITIQDLDGPRTYQGTAVGTHIQFDRNGVKESIHATDGTATGMKWLSDKSNCLTIRPGEGYCRD